MSLEIFYGVLAGIETLIQLVLAYWTYKLSRFHKESKIWILLTIALITMGVRRGIVTLIMFGYLDRLSGAFYSVERVFLPLIISSFLLIGAWIIKKEFENFKIIEKSIEKKAKILNKK